MSSGYSFTDLKGNTKIFGLNGSAIDGVYIPTPKNSKAIYTYGIGTGSSRKLAQLAGNAPAPPQSVLIQVIGDYPSPVTPPPAPAQQQVATPPSIPTPAPALGAAQVSDGSVYLNPGGGQLIQVPQGQPVPDLWVKQTTPPASDANVVQAPFVPLPVGDDNISTGETFINPGNGAYINVPAGNPVPNLWMRVPDTEIPPSANVIQAPDVATVVQQAAEQAQIASALKAIVPIVGVAGFAYIAYLIIFKPNQAKYVIERLTLTKDIVVDGAWIAVAGGILLAGGFVTYEFVSYYNHYGSVGKALEYMTEDVIVNTLNVIVDVLLGAVKATIDYGNKSGIFGFVGSSVSLAEDLAGGMSLKESFKDSFGGAIGQSIAVDENGWTK